MYSCSNTSSQVLSPFQIVTRYTYEKIPYLTIDKLLLPYLTPKLKIFPICHLFHLLFPIWHFHNFLAVTTLSPKQKDHITTPMWFLRHAVFKHTEKKHLQINKRDKKNMQHHEHSMHENTRGARWSFCLGLNAVTAKKWHKCQIGNKRGNRWQIGKNLSFGIK